MGFDMQGVRTQRALQTYLHLAGGAWAVKHTKSETRGAAFHFQLKGVHVIKPETRGATRHVQLKAVCSATHPHHELVN